MKAGYVLVNAKGVDLNKTGETTQTVSGIYSKLTKAIATGKLVILEGVVNSTAALTPIPVSASIVNNAVVISYNLLTISVASNDVITITPYTPKS